MLTELWKNKTQNTNKDAPRENKGASLVAQIVRNPPAMQKTWVLSLGQEDSLEKGVATHFSILIWRIPWTEEPGKLCPWGHKELDMAERLIHSCRT